MSQSPYQILASALPTTPHVEVGFPSAYEGFVDIGVGFLGGLYVPLAYHAQHDCYSMSLWSVQHFIELSKSFNEIYNDANFNLGRGVENGIEIAAWVSSLYFALDLCTSQKPAHEVSLIAKRQVFAAKKALRDQEKEEAEGDDEEGEVEEDAEEADREPADGSDYGDYGDYGFEEEDFFLKTKLEQFDDFVEDYYDEEDEGAEQPEDEANEDEPDLDEKFTDGRMSEGEKLFIFDMVVHGLDCGFSGWKAANSFLQGYWYWSLGEYTGRFIGDIIAMAIWGANKANMIDYYNDAYETLGAYQSAYDLLTGEDLDVFEDEAEPADDEFSSFDQ